jgi:hypothetical protein
MPPQDPHPVRQPLRLLEIVVHSTMVRPSLLRCAIRSRTSSADSGSRPAVARPERARAVRGTGREWSQPLLHPLGVRAHRLVAVVPEPEVLELSFQAAVRPRQPVQPAKNRRLSSAERRS